MDEKDFLIGLKSLIEENMGDEKFGVSQLADKMHFSRSALLRKVKKHNDLSVNQLIRKTRLERSKELLENSQKNVSEVAFEVGFGSSSYFIKCFREEYGYSPGQAGKIQDKEKESNVDPKGKKKGRKSYFFIFPLLFLLVVAIFLLVYYKPLSKRVGHLEKTIAVLPFINDSKDSTNVYFINGLMESILNNLQKIEDLHVISRTSVEKFRYGSKTIPELSKALNANYFVEGSGQRIGDEIYLHIQLIEAPTDRHLWSGSFRKKTKDIFSLQSEIAKTIAEKAEAFVSLDEKKRIEKVPTDDLLAYDHFLKGLDLLSGGNLEGVEASIPYFEKAINRDENFARAHSALAIAYYFKDAGKAEKKNSAKINEYSDQALFLDPEIPQAHVAKALYYINIFEYEKAIPYFEKALEFNPNSDLALGFLTDFYANYFPNTEKYLEYAIRSTKLDIASKDSVSASFIYLHLGNAFIQSGFVEEARKYINLSMEHDPKNLFSDYVNAYISYAENEDLKQLNLDLLDCLNKDSSRYDIIQEVAKSYYFLRDFEKANEYYDLFLDITSSLKLDVYASEKAKIALTKYHLGMEKEAAKYFDLYKLYADQDKSLYKDFSLAIWNSWNGNMNDCFDHLEKFTLQDNFHYWTLLFLPFDPLMDPIKNDSRYDAFKEKIEDKFWKQNMEMRRKLEKKGLI